MSRVVVCIPARLASTRFPNKPLATIDGDPMIVHVINRAKEAGVGDVLVACCEEEVKALAEHQGVKAVMTDPTCPSGTDRIAQALELLGEEYDIIVNLQGDLPTIDANLIKQAVRLMDDESVDIATLAAIIKDEEEVLNPNVVKIAMNKNGRALYFSRSAIPHGEGAYYHHIGLYVYRRNVLKQFVSWDESGLEKRERLEQLRALEHGLHIQVGVVNTVPIGVDTEEDRAKAEKELTCKKT